MLIYFQPQAQRTVLSLFHFGLVLERHVVPRRERDAGRAQRRVHDGRRALEDLPQAPRRSPARPGPAAAAAGAQADVRSPSSTAAARTDRSADPRRPTTSCSSCSCRPACSSTRTATWSTRYGGAEKLLEGQARGGRRTNVLELLERRAAHRGLRRDAARAQGSRAGRRSRASASHRGDERDPLRGDRAAAVPSAHERAQRARHVPRDDARRARQASGRYRVDEHAHPDVGGLGERHQRRSRPSCSTRARRCRRRSRSSRPRTRRCRRRTRSSSPRTRSCRARTRSCTRSTRSSTRSTPSTSTRSPSSRSSTPTWRTCSRAPTSARCSSIASCGSAGSRRRSRACSGSSSTTSAAEIRDFSHNIERPQLMDEIEQALRDGHDRRGRGPRPRGTPYFLRILPYRIRPRATATRRRSTASC